LAVENDRCTINWLDLDRGRRYGSLHGWLHWHQRWHPQDLNETRFDSGDGSDNITP
jgi:hypothetical protein